ncbi:MAG: heliorhodopsin HeR, partial [Acidimicrobiia bacterium]|nr:heliorhodopsin HeR [Acidimicrobiia bacterium]
MRSAATTERRSDRLRLYNLVMGGLHAIQAVAVLVLANDFTLPVTGTFLTDAPGINPPEVSTIFELRIAWGVAAFLFLSAAAHWIIAAPGVYGWYRANLDRNRNYARWIEYSLSASLMVVLIAILPGSGDIAALIALFGVNAAMILFGLLQEHYEQPGRPGLLPFWFGSIAGAVPWIAIGVYLWAPGVDATTPGFVYGIFFSLFV